MLKIDVTAIPRREGASGYPSPYHEPCRARARRALGDAAGLSQFGVNLLHLPPDTWSSQRRWHTHEDELVWVVEGEVVLVTDAGEEVLRAGDCAGFPAGVANGQASRTAPTDLLWSSRSARKSRRQTPPSTPTSTCAGFRPRPHARTAHPTRDALAFGVSQASFATAICAAYCRPACHPWPIFFAGATTGPERTSVSVPVRVHQIQEA